MKKFVIRDDAFAHAKFSTDFQESKYIEWDRGEASNDDIVIYTDSSLHLAADERCRKKIAWLLEPYDIQPHAYNFVRVCPGLFDIVLSHNRQFIEEIPNGHWVPFGGCWIEEKDQVVYEKTKLVSIIASGKRWLEGHQLRHQVVESASSLLHVAGRGYKEIDYKLDMLKNYAFHVVIENTKIEGYFTEKLIDSFLTGSLPIYWGDPSIGEIFDTRGMIICNNINDIVWAINNASLDYYKEVKNYVAENFYIAKEYKISEDYMYQNILKTYE
jgi:hypothetical protein